MDVEVELFSSIARLTENINANGQPQTPSLLPSRVAVQILNHFDPPLDMDDIVKLKMYLCDKPDFAKLFIDMSQYERIKYVELQLKALWIINFNDKLSMR